MGNPFPFTGALNALQNYVHLRDGEKLQHGEREINICGCQLSWDRRRMVTPGRFERPTYSLGNCCSIHLSYGATSRIAASQQVSIMKVQRTKHLGTPLTAHSLTGFCKRKSSPSIRRVVFVMGVLVTRREA
jgi:hypothetical protein